MTNASGADRRKTTIHTIADKKRHGEPIAVITAYDYPSALILDRSGVDAILVGDSLGTVVLGYENTLPVTMEDMIHHCKAVARGAGRAHLIGDMPFMSFQASTADAVRNAGRFLQEAGMDAVKLEGGSEVVPAIKAILAAGIPVMAHVGLTPQSLHKLGGYKVQGASSAAAQRLLEEAQALENAGCYAIVLEAVPDRVAELITRRLHIPTIGIGAGIACDGQVLVGHDLLGCFDRSVPKFARKYADLATTMARAYDEFIADVRARRFPTPDHAYHMRDEEYEALQRETDSAAADAELPTKNGTRLHAASRTSH